MQHEEKPLAQLEEMVTAKVLEKRLPEVLWIVLCRRLGLDFDTIISIYKILRIISYVKNRQL